MLDFHPGRVLSQAEGGIRQDDAPRNQSISESPIFSSHKLGASGNSVLRQHCFRGETPGHFEPRRAFAAQPRVAVLGYP